MRSSGITGSRVRLRPLNEAHLAAIDAWYGEAASVAYEERPLEQLYRAAGKKMSELLAIAQPEADEPIGLLEYRHEGQLVTVEFIALTKTYRGWGYGSEAVRLLEDWATREGIVDRFQADVPIGNGLGLYFWLRLGYRPAGRDEFGWRGDALADRMAMVRVA